MGAILIASATGCASKVKVRNIQSVRLGQFTVASSYNVRNLHYGNGSSTKGEDCSEIGLRMNTSRVQRAMDNAIRNGQKQGLVGDILVNVRIDEIIVEKSGGSNKSPKRYNCMTVTGDLVKIDR